MKSQEDTDRQTDKQSNSQKAALIERKVCFNWKGVVSRNAFELNLVNRLFFPS